MAYPIFIITVMLFGTDYTIIFKAVECLHSRFLQ